MKFIITLSLLCTIAIAAHSQEEKKEPARSNEPLFAMLHKVKDGSEDVMRARLMEQQLTIDIISDEPKGNKNKEIIKKKQFDENAACVKAYNTLRSSADQLITQLKADLTMSNRKKLLKNLNEGAAEAGSWYKLKMDEIVKQYNGVKGCIEQKASGATLEELTGLFSALVGIVTSARDFRWEQIKLLCEQLETLRIAHLKDLLSANASAPGKKESEDKND